MKTVPYSFSSDIPLTHEADVVVIGGGPGGLGAAVSAARNGAKTLLVERNGYLGGMATAGEVNPFMKNHLNANDSKKTVCLDKPLYVEWIRRMASYLPKDEPAREITPEISKFSDRFISKEAAMLAAEDLCLEAGVKLLYHHNLVDVVLRDNSLQCAVLHSKSGFSAVGGKVFIDSTGDGDLAALSGCAFEQGGPTGACQPMTLCFKLDNIDNSKAEGKTLQDWFRSINSHITRLYCQAKQRGELDCPRENILSFPWFRQGVVHFNTTRILHKLATNGTELSEAEIEGRRQMRQLLSFLRKDVPGFANARICSVASHIGVRETRRVLGRSYLTRKSFDTCEKFPDGVARMNYPIDIHNPDGSGTEIAKVPPEDWYEIPYGCLVARDRDNLLIASRCISVDHAIHSSIRVMPSMVTVGFASGLAAAKSAKNGVKPGDLDGRKLRQILKSQGASL